MSALGIGAHLCILTWHFQFIFLKIKSLHRTIHSANLARVWQVEVVEMHSRNAVQLLKKIQYSPLELGYVDIYVPSVIQGLKTSVMLYLLREAAQNLQSLLWEQR